MGKQLLDIVWIIFTREEVDYKTVLWDDFIQYVGKKITERVTHRAHIYKTMVAPLGGPSQRRWNQSWR